MNFQQIKPSSCDVFVWVAVWRDVIKYWVFASKEIENNKWTIPEIKLDEKDKKLLNVETLDTVIVHDPNNPIDVAGLYDQDKIVKIRVQVSGENMTSALWQNLFGQLSRCMRHEFEHAQHYIQQGSLLFAEKNLTKEETRFFTKYNEYLTDEAARLIKYYFSDVEKEAYCVETVKYAKITKSTVEKTLKKLLQHAISVISKYLINYEQGELPEILNMKRELYKILINKYVSYLVKRFPNHSGREELLKLVTVDNNGMEKQV